LRFPPRPKLRRVALSKIQADIEIARINPQLIAPASQGIPSYSFIVILWQGLARVAVPFKESNLDRSLWPCQ